MPGSDTGQAGQLPIGDNYRAEQRTPAQPGRAVREKPAEPWTTTALAGLRPERPAAPETATADSRQGRRATGGLRREARPDGAGGAATSKEGGRKP